MLIQYSNRKRVLKMNDFGLSVIIGTIEAITWILLTRLIFKIFNIKLFQETGSLEEEK